MDLTVELELPLTAVVILLILLPATLGAERTELRGFRACICCVLCSCASEITGRLGMHLRVDWLAELGATGFLALVVLSLYAWLGGVLRVGRGAVHALLLTLNASYALLAISNPLHHQLFTLAITQGELLHGRLFPCLYVVVGANTLAFWLIPLWRARQAGNYIERRRLLLAALFPTLSTLGGFAQLLNHQPLAGLGAAVGFTFYFIAFHESRVVHDPLTGLNNRNHVLQFLTEHYRRPGRPALSLVAFDINHCREVNRRHGYAEGDRALRRVGAAVRQTALDLDAYCARFTGDTFIMIAESSARRQLLNCVATVRQRVNERSYASGANYDLTLDVALCELPEEFDDLPALRGEVRERLHLDRQRHDRGRP
ncbi:MAG: GGDEF domain-containing protein [Succinivibrionaceae bacterium]|nr:GGDEF domain-containing protein [Succinivibrionaceae bacterium]